MKRLIFVVFLLLPYPCFANEVDRIVHSIEAEWASIYFSSEIRDKENAYTRRIQPINATLSKLSVSVNVNVVVA